MNLFKNFFLIPLLFVSPLLITSCSDDDDDDHDHDHDHTQVVAPDNYEFERDGLSTVSFCQDRHADYKWLKIFILP